MKNFVKSEKVADEAVKVFAKRHNFIIIDKGFPGTLTLKKNAVFQKSGKSVSPREKNSLPTGVPLRGWIYQALKDGQEAVVYCGFDGRKGGVKAINVANKTTEKGQIECNGHKFNILQDAENNKYLAEITPCKPCKAKE